VSGITDFQQDEKFHFSLLVADDTQEHPGSQSEKLKKKKLRGRSYETDSSDAAEPIEFRRRDGHETSDST
jgi:hypothetical protein